MLGILKMILPVLIMIAVGAVCRKKGVVQRQGVAGLKALIVNVCLPAVLIGAFYRAQYSIDIVVTALSMFVICLAALGLGFLVKRFSKAKMRSTPFLMTGFEAGMLGYALFTLLFGAARITYFATADLGQVLFVFTVYLVLLKKEASFKDSVKTMVKSPVIISIVLGVVIGATGLGRMVDASAAGETVSYIFEFIAAPTAVLILFVIGYELELKKLNLRITLSTLLARAALMALLCVALLAAIGLIITVSEYLKWALILMFVLPPPFIIPIFVDNSDENAYVSATLSSYTVLSLIAFALIAYLSL